ncbi:hypothetical protein DFJ74DRAFT_766181 [Hyaloraphidium curvatum]|nr:hypothetical protein DFJ74DRAFT_766181 [Hyaloraphidium curvatum]
MSARPLRPLPPARSTADILLRGTAYTAIILGIGWVLMTKTTPKDEELGKLLREKGYENRIDPPDVHKKKMEAMFAKMREDTQSDKPVWDVTEAKKWRAKDGERIVDPPFIPKKE